MMENGVALPAAACAASAQTKGWNGLPLTGSTPG